MSNDEHENSDADSILKRIDNLAEYLRHNHRKEDEDFCGTYPNITKEVLKCQNTMRRCVGASRLVLENLMPEEEKTLEEVTPLLECLLGLGEAERNRHEALSIYTPKNPPKSPNIFGELLNWSFAEK